MDRSMSGWTMHQYGSSILTALHQNSSNPMSSNESHNTNELHKKLPILLLAHTDLNWNPVRYLLSCESTEKTNWSHVQHISIQVRGNFI